MSSTVKIVELNARDRGRADTTVFELLSKQDAIVVLRDVPEIHQIRAAVLDLTTRHFGATRSQEVDEIFRTGMVPSLEAYAAAYRALIHLRNSRFFSCLLSDRIAELGLPLPALVDSGFCRMVAPRYVNDAYERRDLFGPDEPATGHPNEAEGARQGVFWGDAHRDITVWHHHYQCNIWFPLHPLAQCHSLVLFPDLYRSDVPQRRNEGEPAEPDTWGYGKATQVPLQFGDMLVFHSQQLHASPYLGPERDRLTIELRIAAGCPDDNAALYRRLFWNLDNFKASTAEEVPAPRRAEELVHEPSKAPDLEHILAGRTAHAVYHRLFRRTAGSLRAGYIHREAKDLDDAARLDRGDWTKVIGKLAALPAGDDLWLAIVRILLRQGQNDLAGDVLSRVIRRTKSYFWALECGRIAAGAGRYDLAAAAFRAAEFRAGTAKLTLVPPVPGTAGAPEHLLQLTPPVARRAAVALAARAEMEASRTEHTTPTFDHRFFWPPYIIASYANYDIVTTGELFVALPVSRMFNPEQILADPTGVMISETIEGLATGRIEALGEKLPTPRPTASASDIGDHVLFYSLNGWYVIPKNLLPIDPASQDLARLPGVTALQQGTNPHALHAAAVELAAQHSRLAAENQQLRQIVAQVQARGGLRGIGKPHMDEDFLLYSFYDDREAISVSLAAVIGNTPRAVRLVGRGPLASILAGRLRDHGHTVEILAWSFADPVPANGFPGAILCDIPKSFDDWAKYSALANASHGQLQALWSLVLPWSVLAESLSKYEYNAGTLDELAKVYRGGDAEVVGRRSPAELKRLQEVFPLRGKTVAEFGPSDGNHTADLLAAGAAHVTALEGRPENVIKLLLAKYVMGWKNFDVVMDNFQTMATTWADRRFDLVYAQGVYYHCQNPLVFLDGLTRMGDAIYIGGWTATDEKPRTPWVQLEHDGVKYRGKVYTESYHFLSGLASQSYMLDKEEIMNFFSRRGYATAFCDVTLATNELGTEFVHMFVQKR